MTPRRAVFFITWRIIIVIIVIINYPIPLPSSSIPWQFLQGGRQGHPAAGLVGPGPRFPRPCCARRSRATPRESYPRRVGYAGTTARGPKIQDAQIPHKVTMGKGKWYYHLESWNYEEVWNPVPFSPCSKLWKFFWVQVRIIKSKMVCFFMFFGPWWILWVHQGTDLAHSGGDRDLWQPTRSDWAPVEMMCLSLHDYNWLHTFKFRSFTNFKPFLTLFVIIRCP